MLTLSPLPPAPTTDDDLPVLSLVEPILGFPEHRRFALVQLDDAGLTCSLRSLDEPDLSFLVVPPGPFFPDYAPEVEDDLVASLGIEDGDPVVTVVLVNAGADASAPTANLLAPVVVNHRTRLAAQVVQQGDLPVRAPLWPDASDD
ncbi:flagellar assembly protein FliW [Solicola sp. PLA-1-18]|uniref:flagellar assembly protein FliW n=1 Tax=Solicola sp. PLA-1-18 TaxID=3380532 RepID=UPI003B7E2215